MRTFVLGFLVVVGVASFSLAAEPPPTPEPGSDCARNYVSLLKCVELRAPQILRARASVAEGEALPGQAKEWTNPNFNLLALKSSGKEPSGDSIQGSLAFQLDFFGIRNAREKKAILESKDRRFSAEIEKQNVLRASYLDLHRIRQIETQLGLLQETLKSLGALIQIYQRRPRLSPEQEASRETLQMAQFEIQNRINLLKQESHGFVHDIEIQIGENWSPSPQNLPQPPKSWPKVVSNTGAEGGVLDPQSPAAQRLRVLGEVGDASMDVVRAEKHAVIQIGPAAEWGHMQSEEGVRAGITFQMPIPLLESYSGSYNLLEQTQRRARVNSETELREVLGELDHNQEFYSDSIVALNHLESNPDVRKRLERVEKLYRQGLIAGTSYLEALRQDLSLRQSKDELEIKAIDAWCQIQALQNHFEACFL